MDGDEHGEVEESSSKRRERLLALRSAATASPAAASPPPAPAPAPSLLPDLDLAGDQRDAAPRAQKPHRFDFYTNPGAAFSSSGGGGSNPTYPHKRKSPPACYAPNPAPPAFQPQPYGGPGNYGSNYPPPNQHRMALRSPSPMPQDAPGSSPLRIPMQFDPMSGYHGTPGGAPSWGPRSGPFGFRHPNPGRVGNPMNYGPRGSPQRGRGHNYNNNSSPGSWGRGGRGGGGVGFQNYSGQQDRRSFMSKFMVEDPWQGLEPIIGNILLPRDGSRSWLPESLREKKVTPPAGHHGQIKPTSSSGLSLAEYLDLSFNEASNEA